MSVPTVSIVVPAYNERRRLPKLLGALREADAELTAIGLNLTEAVIVNDGSTDETPELLLAARSSDPKLRPVLGDGVNHGKGAAVAAGIRAARGDLILIADADVATPFSELRHLYAGIKSGADVVVGSRDAPGSNVEDAPRQRVVMGRIFNRIARWATGLRIRDTQCGFKLIRADAARSLVGEQIVTGFAFDVELLLRARLSGMKTDEIGVQYRHGLHSTVSPLRHAPQMILDILRLMVRLRVLRRRTENRPAAELR